MDYLHFPPEYRSRLTSIVIALFEDRHYPKHCPVILFLTLAVSYGKFTHDLEALYEVKARCAADTKFSSVDFPFLESFLEKPVFKSNSSGGMWSYGVARNQLRDLGVRAGFEDLLTCYCIRRGAVDKLLRRLTSHKTIILGLLN
jgi:hypothetical protein